MGDEAARQARIEARRRRLHARERQEDCAEQPEGDCLMVQQAAQAPHTSRLSSPSPRSLSPEDNVGTKPRPSRVMPAQPSTRRVDHQDTFGTRSSIAEGLVDAPTHKAAKPRGAETDAGFTASKLDLDFASVERASARIKRSSKAGDGISALNTKPVDTSQTLAHKAALLSAEQANRPVKLANATAVGARAHTVAPKGFVEGGKGLITGDEEKALWRLQVGPREEADGINNSVAMTGKNAAAGGSDSTKYSVVGEDGISAIDAKAMDRLARQNNELKKLADAQRRELERLQQAYAASQLHASQTSPLQAPPPARAAAGAVLDPWQGELKQRGVRNLTYADLC